MNFRKNKQGKAPNGGGGGGGESRAPDVDGALSQLLQSATDKAASDESLDRSIQFQSAVRLARLVLKDLHKRLDQLEPDVRKALLQISPTASTYCVASSSEQESLGMHNLLKDAKRLGYVASAAEYRSYAKLSMDWPPKHASMQFSVHGIGQKFDGRLICAPLFDILSKDAEGWGPSAIVPVAEEGFIFCYNEDAQELLARLQPWREQVLANFLGELKGRL